MLSSRIAWPRIAAACLALVSLTACEAVTRSPATCPITVPNERPLPVQETEMAFANHGNGSLWVAAPGQALFMPPEPDGTFYWKIPWWRQIPGQLRIEGRRVDAPAPPLRASIPEGYGAVGFQPSGLTFPTVGCWEVTGRVGDERLTIVVEIGNAYRFPTPTATR